MKKLLHEQLREWANSDEPNYRPMQEMGIIHGWSYGRTEGSKFLNELASEIERCYIPRHEAQQMLQNLYMYANAACDEVTEELYDSLISIMERDA